MHNEQLMGIRREEEMEMSDDDMEDAPDSKDSEDSGMHMHARIHTSTLLSSLDRTRTSRALRRMNALIVKYLREVAASE